MNTECANWEIGGRSAPNFTHGQPTASEEGQPSSGPGWPYQRAVSPTAGRERAAINPVQQSVYRENERLDVLPYIPASAKSALDVGCAAGGFGKTLRRVLGNDARIVGVEAVREQAAIARNGHGFDEVVDGYFPDALNGRAESFELVTFNDVLEHILEPEDALRETGRFMAPHGKVVAAIPSIQYAPAVLNLMRGRWDYTDSGILDRTHVRFFTRQTMVEMFGRAGYRVERCVGTNSLRGYWQRDPFLPRRYAKLAIARVLGDAQYLHFVIVAAVQR